MKCLNCGHENPEGNVFCTKCASKLEHGIACPKCGNVNLPGSNFCAKCAAKLSEKVYCRFCGSELTDGRCQNCGRDQAATPTTPPSDKPADTQPAPVRSSVYSQAGSASVNTPEPPSQGGSLATPCILSFIAILTITICMLSEWISVSIWGSNYNYTIFEITDFARKLGSLTGSVDTLVFIGYIFIGLTLIMVAFYGICAIKLLDGGKEIRADALKHMRIGNRFTISICALIIIIVMIVNGEAEHEIGGSILEIEFNLVLSLLIALFIEIYGRKWLFYLTAAALERSGDYRTALTLYRYADSVGDSQARASKLRTLMKGNSELAIKSKQASMIACPHCGRLNARVSETCAVCGKPLQDRIKQQKCPHCGRFNASFAVNCTICGKPLQPQEATGKASQ